jgi:phosphatidylglycerol:prolipoprotein diacylglycerol transferase
VYPSQIFESGAALVICLLLVFIERSRLRAPEETSMGAILFPIFSALYGLYRIVFDFLRAGDRIFGFRVGQYTGLLGLIVGVCWLAFSLTRKSAKPSLEERPR